VKTFERLADNLICMSKEAVIVRSGHRTHEVHAGPVERPVEWIIRRNSNLKTRRVFEIGRKKFTGIRAALDVCSVT
jgi:hypothetical protein